MAIRIEIDPGPGRSRQRPFGFGSLLEMIDVAELQLHAIAIAPAVVFALQIAIEERLLQRSPVIGVEMSPMLETMNLQPFFAGGGAHEPFKIAARMQPLTAPVCSRKEGNRHLVPLRRASPVIVVIKRMTENVIAEAAAVARKFAVGQRFVATHPQP